MTENEIVREIKEALETLNLPTWVSLKEIRERYRALSKKYHPDVSKDGEKMREINKAYTVLKNYIENYRFTFSRDEILKQFPQEQHASKFKF